MMNILFPMNKNTVKCLREKGMQNILSVGLFIAITSWQQKATKIVFKSHKAEIVTPFMLFSWAYNITAYCRRRYDYANIRTLFKKGALDDKWSSLEPLPLREPYTKHGSLQIWGVLGIANTVLRHFNTRGTQKTQRYISQNSFFCCTEDRRSNRFAMTW